jgi:Tol biopolymer transport system component
MKTVLTLLLLLPAALLAAELSNPKPISPQTGYCISPDWSPDGKLYCSIPNFTVIFQVNCINGAIKPIAKGAGIGFKFAISPNGNIFYKKVIDPGRELWMVDSTLHAQLLASAEAIGLPIWYDGAIRVQFPDTVRSWDESGKEIRESADGWVYQDGEVIYRVRKGAEPQRISPVIFKGCCLPVMSPQEDKVAYETAQNGLVMVNLVSGASVPVGPGNNAVWSPDGTFLLFDMTRNDGKNLTAGDIFYIKSDGTGRQNLTENLPAIATDPTISPDGKKVAFSANGRIWIADLKP